MKPKLHTKDSSGFQALAKHSSNIVGSKWAFFAAVCAIGIWGLLGPVFHFSDTWQLVINTATTIITFLIVFLIQNTQNREARALHLKLDEIIHAMTGAEDEMINIENLTDEELNELATKYDVIRRECESRKLKTMNKHGLDN